MTVTSTLGLAVHDSARLHGGWPDETSSFDESLYSNSIPSVDISECHPGGRVGNTVRVTKVVGGLLWSSVTSGKDGVVH